MKVYHYTRPQEWENIKVQGLKPNHVESERSGEKLKNYTYCLLSPEAEEWVNNRYFPDLFDKLTEHFWLIKGGLLLEIDCSKLPVFIGEHLHLMSLPGIRKPKETIPEEYVHELEKEAEDAYIKSLVTIDEYHKRKTKYLIPEVILPEGAPPDKIKICENQPLLEGVLDRYDLYTRSLIAEIPELSPWRSKMWDKYEGSFSSESKK